MKSKARLIQLHEKIYFRIRFLIPIAFLIGSCGTATPEPVPSEEPSRSPPAIAEEISEGETSDSPSATIDSQPFFVPGEVIVMGDPATFKPIVDEVSIGLGLTLNQEIEDEIELEGPTYIYLYSFDSENDHDTFLLLDALANEGVTVDPNFYTSISSYDSCGSPVMVDGEPFEVDGSPFEVDGSGQAGNAAPADSTQFTDQWAWDSNIEISRELIERDQTKPGAAIAIFDTNPFSVGSNSTSQVILDLMDDFQLHDDYVTFPERQDDSWSKDHAAFIAGIANHIAPGSQVHLIPVLNDDACGDLFKLLMAMDSFLDGDFGTAIYNLSLGIEHPGYQIDVNNLESTNRGIRFYRVIDFLRDRNVNAEMIDLFIRVLLAPVETLDAVISEVTKSGNVVVAAAGNDSFSSDDRLEPNLPAAFGNVIGVGAITLEGNPACYSNMADIYAPGGDGSGEDCLPVSASCTDADCPYGVISWSMFTNSGYRFWSGTSFATAIVSGLIANPSPESH